MADRHLALTVGHTHGDRHGPDALNEQVTSGLRPHKVVLALIANEPDSIRRRLGLLLMLRRARVGARVRAHPALMPQQRIHLWSNAVADHGRLLAQCQRLQLLLTQLLPVVVVAVTLRKLALGTRILLRLFKLVDQDGQVH